MMLRTAILAVLVCAAGSVADAQNLRNDLIDIGPPAEFPPETYEGRQYVDSRGCVYVRAGAIGEPSWVPRVTARRKVLCGFRPTQIARAAPPVIADPAPAPGSRIGTAAPAAPRVAATPAPAPTAPQPYGAARNAPTADQLQRFAQARRTVATQSRRVATQPRRAVQPTPRVSAAPSPSVRGQVSPPTTAAALVPGERIAVRRAPEIRTPPGYRKAWDDGRLNPDRGKQTLRGALQTALVWTQTVPRRLKTSGGRDVTDTYHYLVYPYTDYDKQLRDLRGGKFITVKTNQGVQIVPRTALRRTASGKTVLSSKSAPAPRQAGSANGARYVQVATFGDGANADRSARQLRAAGLPVRMSRFTKGGKSYTSVLAGPFGDGNGVAHGLKVARAQGFRDAFAR